MRKLQDILLPSLKKFAVITAIAAVLVALGMTRFKVRPHKQVNFAKLRDDADKKLTLWIYVSQNETDRASKMGPFLDRHFALMVEGLQPTYGETRFDILYWIHMVTTTGNTGKSASQIIHYVLYFTTCIMFMGYVYTAIGTALQKTMCTIFELFMDESYDMDYDPVVSLGEDKRLVKENPTTLEKSRPGGIQNKYATILSKMQQNISCAAKESIVPATMYIFLLFVYCILCTFYVSWVLPADYFDAFTMFCNHVSMTEPYDTPHNVQGYIMVAMGILGQVGFLLSLHRLVISLLLVVIPVPNYAPLVVDDAQVRLN